MRSSRLCSGTRKDVQKICERQPRQARLWRMDSREALIALNMVEGVGPVRARSLLEHFGEAPKILSASRHQLLRVRSIVEDTAGNISNWEKSVDLAGEL